MNDFRTLLAEAGLPETSVEVCMAAQLTAEFEQAERDLIAAERAATTGSLEGTGTGEYLARLDELRELMQAGSYVFRLRGLPRKQFRKLIDAHPARTDDEGNTLAEDLIAIHGVARYAFNTSTMYEPLLKATVYDPADLTDDEWREMLGDSDAERERREAAGLPVEDGKLTDSQITELINAAMGVCVGDVSVPFSPAASRIRRNSVRE
ncbi:hypothetical protein GCM10010435_44460 [Winogradskya consettensis]|uniref:Uncharacterized protein n=1 Tax=Winogradskya consettensis TaxID=113560 RepID=A0A919VWK0_9ACTN|nr:hypothetical protein [Actinoplanes consettensis]GIM82704.1 hypothetical protein Aco04nite_82850 [Actinoplanes consettensis]